MQNTHNTPLILVVDDNSKNLQVLGNLLRDNGYKPVLAENGAEAVEFSRKTPPDLILLDIMMPDMDGIETCRRLKEQDATRDIPVIFITALTEIPDKLNAFDVGGVDYIGKPFQPAEVLVRVKTHLTIRQLQQRLQRQNTTLADQNDQLNALNVSKDKFFSIIAHDLRGPLTSLQSLIRTIEENIERYSPAALKKLSGKSTTR